MQGVKRASGRPKHDLVAAGFLVEASNSQKVVGDSDEVVMVERKGYKCAFCDRYSQFHSDGGYATTRAVEHLAKCANLPEERHEEINDITNGSFYAKRHAGLGSNGRRSGGTPQADHPQEEETQPRRKGAGKRRRKAPEAVPRKPSDPWQNVTTRHGFPADQVISALQKEVRRGKTENAMLLAYEMATTSAELENKLWQRLRVISVEDVGFGDPQAPILLHTLHQFRKDFDYSDGEPLLFVTHAIRYLCEAQKDRGTDELIIWTKQSVEEKGLRPTIPDYALDMHTRQGMAMGRGMLHFMEHATVLSPELPNRDKSYRDKVMAALAESS